MKHLTENQLNEYLDGALESPTQARLVEHLSDCADCQARLASLQTVFQTLAALPEEILKRDLTPSVLQSLPRNRTGLAWRLAFAFQAGISLGILVLFVPIATNRIARLVQGLTGRFAMPDVKLPMPVDLHFSLPVVRLPHPAIPTLPIAITHDNSAIWLILGIATILLFVVGNSALVLHNTSDVQK